MVLCVPYFIYLFIYLSIYLCILRTEQYLLQNTKIVSWFRSSLFQFVFKTSRYSLYMAIVPEGFFNFIKLGKMERLSKLAFTCTYDAFHFTFSLLILGL